MFFRFSKAPLSAAFILFSFALNAQNFAVKPDSTLVKQGQVGCVAVVAQGFTNIAGYQYSLEFNEQVMTFHHAQNFGLPDMSAANFNLYQPGVLATAWTDPVAAGITRVDGTVLYEVCFTAVGSVGSSSPVTPGGTLPPNVGGAGVYDGLGNDLWNPNFNVPGLVEINLAASAKDLNNPADASFELSPNPTQSAALARLKSGIATEGTLSVTDASGRLVLEQKIKVRVGENDFEIPAKALTAKGMYQITIKTAQGISSQILSVN